MKPLLLCFVLLAIIGNVKAQSPDKLRREIQRSRSDTNRIRLQLALGSYYLNKAGQQKTDLDSAIYFFNKATQLSAGIRNDKFKNSALLFTGEYYQKAADIKRAKACYASLADYYRKKEDRAGEADTWERFGTGFSPGSTAFSEERIQGLERAKNLYTEAHRKFEIARVTEEIANIHMQINQVELAENELNQALELYKAIDYKRLYSVYNLLAILEGLRGHLDKDISFKIEAIENKKSSGDTTEICEAYYELAVVYISAGLRPEALKWQQLAIKTDKKHALNKYFSLTGNLIALGRTKEALDTLNMMAKRNLPANEGDKLELYKVLGECYAQLKEYKIAEGYFLKMMSVDFNEIKRTDEFNYDTYLVMSNQSIGAFYLHIDQPAKSIKYFRDMEQAIKNAKTPIHPIYVSNLYLSLYRYYEAVGNYKEALKNFVQHKKLLDSLFSATKNQQISELNIKYETLQKEQAIKTLESKSALQNAQLQKANMQRNITIAGVAMLLIFSGLIYNSYRHKQQSNLQLQSKQTEINEQNISLRTLVAEKDGLIKDKDKLLSEKDWLLKEVHHRVKNNLQIVMSILSTQSAYLESKAAVAAIHDSRNRVQAISLIHQKLYSKSSVASIDMPAYVSDLVSYLRDCLDTQGRYIRIEQLIEPVKIDLAQAVPIGLILNESITNAIKYAFDDKGGEIIIALQMIGSEHLLLTITDNGKGLPMDFDFRSATSLGMEMMKALSKQLQGDFQVKNKQGVTVSVEFKVEKVLDGNTAEQFNV